MIQCIVLHRDLPLYQNFHRYHLIGERSGLSLFFWESLMIINNSYWVLIIRKGWAWFSQCIISLWGIVQMSEEDSIITFIITSVQFICSIMSNSLQPHEPQHARPPCSSPTPRVHPNPCPLSQWCHPTISSSVIPFSSCPQSFPASGSFPMSQLFTTGGQSIGVSASTSVLPMNTQDWSPLGYTGSPCSPRDSQESSPTPQFKSVNSLALSFLYSQTLTSIRDYWKNHSLD